MITCKIFAGLGEAFGGASYRGTYRYRDLGAAYRHAACLAKLDYEAAAAKGIVPSISDCEQSLIKKGWIDENTTDFEKESMIGTAYSVGIVNRITYSAEVLDEE